MPHSTCAIPGHYRATSRPREQSHPFAQTRPAWYEPSDSDWRLGSEVKRTLDRTVAIIADELTNAGVGEVILDPPIEGGEWPPSFENEGSWHHMGTTRMHESPKLGVVDKNCRLHGTSNFYVAGSSVFPTAGGDFPTITIIALALRLADHIAAELRRQALVGTPCPILTPSQC